jgi:HK97 family phage portal protein
VGTVARFGQAVTALFSGGTQARGPALSSGGFYPVAPRATTGGTYATFASAYTGNEIVYASVRLLSRSASEPHIIGKRMRRNRAEVRTQAQALRALGIHNRAGSRKLDAYLIQNKYIKEVPHHPLVKLVNNPNPKTSRGQLWGTVVMDRAIAGNAFVHKSRNVLGGVQELWRLRPDRVSVITDRTGQVIGYEYRVGETRIEFPAEDVMHFRDPHPLDDHYGLPPLAAAMERVGVDWDMRGFLSKFFSGGGTGPGSILSVKEKLAPEAKTEIRDTFRRTFSGYGGYHEMLILDQTDTSWQRLGLDQGLRDAVPKEINALNEARIAMIWGIPGSIIGLLIGYESSSYANKRQDWQVLWDVVMTPLLSDIDDVLNLSLVPEFGGIDELEFDLSDIRALQEDEEALQERARKNFMAGIWTHEEARLATGVDPEPTEGLFFVPGNMQPTPVERLGEEPEPPPPPPQPTTTVTAEEPEEGTQDMVALIRESMRGRPPLLADPGARATYDAAERVRTANPRMTLAQVAARVGISERTYRRYRETFGA